MLIIINWITRLVFYHLHKQDIRDEVFTRQFCLKFVPIKLKMNYHQKLFSLSMIST